MTTLNAMRTLGTIAAVALLLAPTAAQAKHGAQAPHACSSHSAKVVASKCADRNGDGKVEYLPDGTTR